MRTTSTTRRIAIAATSATATNLAILGATRAADVELLVRNGTSTAAVGAAQIATMTVLPLVAGGIALHVARRAGRMRVIEALAVLVTAASLGGPLTMGVGAARLALAAMHLVVGGVFVAVARSMHAAPAARAGRRARVPASTLASAS